MPSHLVGTLGRRCAALLLAAAAAGAQAQTRVFFVMPGHCTGTWTNTTFSTMGAITADVDRRADGSLVFDRVTISGNVFGGSSVAPFTWTWMWNPGPTNYTGSLTGHPVFGNVSGTMTSSGAVTLSGSDVPSMFVDSFSTTGTQHNTSLDGMGVINLSGGGTANTIIHMDLTAFSRLKSATETSGGRYGFAVASSAGNFMHNVGVQIAVGAPMENASGVSQSGRVYIYEAFTELLKLTLQSPGPAANGFFGYSVASIPDVNGDEVPDWIVGAPGEHPGANPAGTGRAYVYSGLDGALLYRIIPPVASAGMAFGSAVAGVPDVNNDGRGDFAVAAPTETVSGLANAGRVYLYSGATGVRLRTIASPTQAANNYFGYSLAGLTDINSDGRGDLVIGQPENSPTGSPTGRSGRVYGFSGSSGALLRTITSPGAMANGFFGASVAGVPDTNGDAVMDIVVGAPWEHPGSSPVNCGRVDLFSGATGGLLRKILPVTPVANGNFGFCVAGAADLNADGFGDVIVGAPGEPGNGSGRAHVYSGANAHRITSIASLYPSVNGHFGSAVAAIPDYTGNSRPEVLIGAPEENPSGTPADCGRSYIARR